MNLWFFCPYKYQKEEELKEKCIIKIDNNIIPFTYYFKFKEEGKYKIEYSFNNYLTKTNHMFFACESLNNINLSNFNTQMVTNMSYMFSGCKSLTTINLSNINTQMVTNMSCMFFGCESLTTINLSNFNTKNVTDMSSMFYGCESLKKENIIIKNIKILNKL